MRWLALVVASALPLAACSGGGDSAAVRIEPIATAAAVGAGASLPSSTPAPPETPAQPAPTVATRDGQTPAPAAAGTTAPGDLAGLPFSTGDVRAAAEQAGVTFLPVEDRAPLCPGSAAPGRPYWSANLAGSDFGPIWVLWVYPDAAAFQEDWETIPGEAPRPRVEDCELPTGFVYWNENLVMTFAVWLSLGEEIPMERHNESPGDHPAVHVFLELTP